jgi:organic radical activating enzyme
MKTSLSFIDHKSKNSSINYSYPIVETFHSIQGEGYWMGVNAFFIRLAGCDVYCSWCDQKESWNPKKYPHFSPQYLLTEVEKANPAIIIITGGEPLMHNLDPLTQELQKAGKNIHLETSGSYNFSGAFDWVTFSPKTYKQPHPSIYNQVNELKVVIADHKDLEWAELQASKIPPHAIKYLQPEWFTPSSQNLVFEYIKLNPNWRLSLQTHKFLGVR